MIPINAIIWIHHLLGIHPFCIIADRPHHISEKIEKFIKSLDCIGLLELKINASNIANKVN